MINTLNLKLQYNNRIFCICVIFSLHKRKYYNNLDKLFELNSTKCLISLLHTHYFFKQFLTILTVTVITTIINS